jgi:hypothetical protein
VSCWAVHVVVTPVTALLTPPYGDTHFRKIRIILSISAKHSKPHCDESLSGLDHWTGLSREDPLRLSTPAGSEPKTWSRQASQL